MVQKKYRYKSQGLILEEKAVKLYANACIGAMGQSSFTYNDIRVAELITGFGRYAIINLAKMLQSNGVKVLYGDTDSLFISGLDKSGVDIVKEAEKFGLKFSLDKRWKVLALNENKKQYFGITSYPEDGKLECKTFFGMKRNQPKYFQNVVYHRTGKECLEQFIDKGDAAKIDTARKRVLEYVRSAYADMKTKIKSKSYDSEFFFAEKADKALYEYVDTRPINFEIAGRLNYLMKR